MAPRDYPWWSGVEIVFRSPEDSAVVSNLWTCWDQIWAPHGECEAVRTRDNRALRVRERRFFQYFRALALKGFFALFAPLFLCVVGCAYRWCMCEAQEQSLQTMQRGWGGYGT